MTDYKPGDKVAITIVGTVGNGGFPNEYDAGFYFTPDHDEPYLFNGSWLFSNGDVRNGRVEVKVIEPPVEVFQPGDIVKSKSGYRYLVGDSGYYSFKSNMWTFRDKEWLETEFTSKNYEKVENND